MLIHLSGVLGEVLRRFNMRDCLFVCFLWTGYSARVSSLFRARGFPRTYRGFVAAPFIICKCFSSVPACMTDAQRVLFTTRTAHAYSYDYGTSVPSTRSRRTGI